MSAEESTDVDAQSQVEHIMQMAESNPAIKDLPEYQNLVKSAEKVRDGGEEKPEQKTEEEEIVDENEEVVDDKKEEEEVIDDDDDTFGLGVNKKKSKDIPTFEEDSEVVDYMKSKYSIKDPSKFFSSVDKWRNQSQKVGELEDNYQQLVDGLGSLPQPIKDAIDAFANAEDYTAAFTSSTPSIDFNGEFEDLDKEIVVSHYFKNKLDKQKGKLDDGDIYEEEYNEYVDDLYDSAKRLFKSDKRDFERSEKVVCKESCKAWLD